MSKVVITGTSRGIGFEMVKILAEQGHEVLALSRNAEPVKSLHLEKVHAIGFDITSISDIERVQQWIAENWNSKLNILINNAGSLLNKPFAESTMQDFSEVYKVNVIGVAELTRQLLPFMDNKGHVVNVSSMGGIQGSMKFPGLAAYSSSKGALITLTELLAEEYKENGPAFNVLALGAVQTEMLEEAFPGYEAPVSAEKMAAYISEFSQNGQQFYNGKIMQVSNSTP
ncbi:SDR family NAD(P)-dependent oxidoreductase [Christiangramia portivictoriae]|uniref:SDR family NAD(P)-dependent oxidoreductase n=1 Tax=Christiangramia portivictoriae TaxID=326069 RepID=UPI00041F958A|nr:SDR family oxidoreductase [Christiangramia portivictoriae]